MSLFEEPPAREYRFNEPPAYHEADEGWDQSRRVKIGKVELGACRIKIEHPFWPSSPVRFAYEITQEENPREAEESNLSYIRRLSEIAHSKCEKAGVHDGPAPPRKTSPGG